MKKGIDKKGKRVYNIHDGACDAPKAKGSEKMTNTELLYAKIKERGLKKKYLAEKVGLTLAGFRNCCTNRTEFRASQIAILCKELKIASAKEKDDIFFAQVGA